MNILLQRSHQAFVEAGLEAFIGPTMHPSMTSTACYGLCNVQG